MSAGQEIVVLSDVHMGACRPGLDAPDPFADDAALCGLLDHLAGRPAQQDRRLRVVLLGDIVDFVLVGAGAASFHRSARAACADLDAIAAAHSEVLAALGRLAHTTGVEVDVVPGNHDMELVLPAVAARLVSLLAVAAHLAPERLTLRVMPWFVHVPGVLHAEHGQQHHDINRFATLAGTPAGWSDGLRRLPPAAHLDALLAARAAGVGGRRFAAMIAEAVPRLAASGAGMTGARLRPPPPDPASGALPPAQLRELERASVAGAAAVVGRLARRARLDLRPAAQATHAILARHGRAVPYVLFGHTHVPLDEPGHLNPGTWSAIGPGAGARTVVRVVAEDDDQAPRARLERWDIERGALVAA